MQFYYFKVIRRWNAENRTSNSKQQKRKEERFSITTGDFRAVLLSVCQTANFKEWIKYYFSECLIINEEGIVRADVEATEDEDILEAVGAEDMAVRDLQWAGQDRQCRSSSCRMFHSTLSFAKSHFRGWFSSQADFDLHFRIRPNLDEDDILKALEERDFLIRPDESEYNSLKELHDKIIAGISAVQLHFNEFQKLKTP